MANGGEGSNGIIDDEDLDLEGGEPKDVVDFFDSTADGVIPDDVDFANRCMAEQGISLGERLALVGTDIDRAVFPVSIHGEPAVTAYGLIDPKDDRGYMHLVEPRCLDGLSMGYSSDQEGIDSPRGFTYRELVFLAMESIKERGADAQQIRANCLAMAKESGLDKKERTTLTFELNTILGIDDSASEGMAS